MTFSSDVKDAADITSEVLCFLAALAAMFGGHPSTKESAANLLAKIPAPEPNPTPVIIPPAPVAVAPVASSDIQNQIAALTNLVGTLASTVASMQVTK